MRRFNSKRFLAALALSMMLTPALSFAAERDGTTLFFSFDDVKERLSNPAPLALFSDFVSQLRPEQARQDGPIERSYRWGNGLGFDGYAYPGTRQPLWGY